MRQTISWVGSTGDGDRQSWAAAQLSFDAYEAFLGTLDDPERRQRLEELKVDDAMTDETFLAAKNAASAFQDGLTKLFFETNDHLTVAAQRYGVF
jgi:hypothetical protein